MKYLKTSLVLVIVLLLHFFLLVNTLFTLWPEMVVYPYLLNNKFLLYRDIINPYTPLFIQFLRFFSMHFGYQPLPYQLFTWATILFIDLLIFKFSLIISKSFKRSIFATLFFVVFSLSLAINGLWFDLVQTPLIIISIYFFYSNYKNKDIQKLAISFTILAIAFFIKQQVIWLFISYVLILFVKNHDQISKKLQRILLLFLPFLILFLIQLFYFKSKSTEQDFIYWAIYFPFIKSSNLPGYILLPNLKQLFITLLIFLIFLPLFKNKKSPKILLFFSIFLLLFTIPRFDYFHLIPAFSILAILSSTYKLDLDKAKLLSAVSIISFLLLSAFSIRYFQRNWNHNIRFFEQDVQIAATLLKFLRTQSPIYIQNGPDQIYPLSLTLPVKPWADEFPWYLEKSDLQDKVVDALRQQNPKIILFQPYSKSTEFDLGSYRPQKIADYLDANYTDIQNITNTLVLKKKK